MAKTPSSKRWLQEHARDPYVRQARRSGYRSRAAYKLIDIDRRDRLFGPGMNVVDLGAAPGGWSQVARERVGADGTVLAVDILEIPAIPGVRSIRGDFTHAAVMQEILAEVRGSVDLVLSDMAPNMSGMTVVDQSRIISLAECALEFAEEALRRGGDLLVKAFQGDGFEAFRRRLRAGFAEVASRKPQASRRRSSEIYLLARGYGA